MAVQIGVQSRLRFKDLISINGVQFWELDNLPQVPEQTDDIYVQVSYTDRIDLLATTYYQDPNFWWVIAVANGMEVLPTDLQPGAVIRIPSPRYVANVLFGRERKPGV